MLAKPAAGTGSAGRASEALRVASSTARNRTSDRLQLISLFHDDLQAKRWMLELDELNLANVCGLANAESPLIAHTVGGRRCVCCMADWRMQPQSSNSIPAINAWTCCAFQRHVLFSMRCLDADGTLRSFATAIIP